MCGISAIYSPRGPISAETLHTLHDPIRHRGPDDEGYTFFRLNNTPPVCFGGKDTPESIYGSGFAYAPTERFSGKIESDVFLALAHHRLSILDLSAAGHQPMCWGSGRYWITYNGEIYNYIELRQELNAIGHHFTSGTDTEVILCAYHEWGRSCLDRFNGMFAFVIFDRQKKCLFAARDRFGVKPLYYRVGTEGTIYFASEIKQLTGSSKAQPRVNGQRAYDFLNWNLIDHTDETLFTGIHQLRNGEAIEIDFFTPPVTQVDGRIPVWRWYYLKPKPFLGSLEEATVSYRHLLNNAIALRMRSDVPVGSCLSGGLDSSAIVCLINRQLREHGQPLNQKVFSAVSEIRRFDESRFINEVVVQNSIASYRVNPSLENLFEEMNRVTWHQDEPFGSTSIYAQWCVFRLTAAHDVKVVLDGQGADEQLAGYHSYFGPWFGSLARQGQWNLLATEIQRAKKLHGYSSLWALQLLLNNLLPEQLRQPLRRVVGKSATTSPYLDLERLQATPLDPFLSTGSARATSVNQLSHAQLMGASLQMLLHCEDRDSMGHSIESRVPFLDYRLVEFTLGLPADFKIHDGWTKRVLREAMSGILPETIRTRVDKMGFVTPEEVWMREVNPNAFRSRLREAVEISDGIIRESVLDYFDKIVAGRRPFNFLIWRLISFGNWLKVFNVAT